MDIDDFLDKEIEGGGKEEVEEKPEVIETTKEEKDAVKRYFSLWDKVSEAKFSWNDEIYTELDKAAKKVKGELGSLSSKIQGQKNVIKRLIDRAFKELRNKDYETAAKIYSEITDMRNSFPDFFLEEKKAINKEIFQLYEKLHDQIDSKFIDDLNESLAKVDKLIRNSFSSIKLGKIEPAKDFYETALETYKNLPNGFLGQKLELGNGLLALYKELSIHMQIKNLQQELDKKSLAGYKFVDSGANLKLLSEIIKNKVEKSGEGSAFSYLKDISAGERRHIHNKALLDKMVARKLDRAKINLKKGLNLEAKKNIDAILKVDPENKEAKVLLSSVPVEY